jgi:multimeric flavodoxin WrbA
MKVLGINGSPKGKNSQTLRLVEAALEGAREAGAEIEFVDICSHDIGYCTGCGTCYETGECVQADDFTSIYDRILAADGIVLGSPNYIDSVTAQLKTLIDRMADAIHCQMLAGKYGCAVCTTGGSGDDLVIDYMNKKVLNRLGAVTVGGVGIALARDPVGLPDAERRARDLGRTLAEAIRTERRYPEQDAALAAQRAYFCALVRANKDRWAHEYEYWKYRGWIKE